VKLGGGGVTVNNMPDGGKFEEAFAKEDATKIGAISEQAMNAQSNIANIDRLGQMLAASPTGAEAAFKSMLGDYGVQTEGLDTLQSAQALINTMIPGQRQPGSGPMSDRDVEMFKASLPRLINSPGGNELILQTMRGIAEYDMQRGQIVQQLRSGQITREQAFDALGQLQNPLSGFGKQVSGMGPQAPQAPAQQAPAQQPVIRRKFNPQTGAFE
jgi:flagellar protein FlgJ